MDTREGLQEAVLEALARCQAAFPDAPITDARQGRRREELVERAETELGWARREAERVYDTAREEGLDPALAVELVRSGVAVCEPEPDDNAAMEGTVEPGPPDWLTPPTALPADPLRERRMRESFRRVRSLLAESAGASEALCSFAAAEDVERCGY